MDPRLQLLISVPLISWRVMMKVQTLHLFLSQEMPSYTNTIILENISIYAININLILTYCVFFNLACHVVLQVLGLFLKQILKGI